MPTASDENLLTVRKRRLIQIFWAVELTLAASGLQRLLLANDAHAALIVSIVALIATSVLYFARQNRLELSATLLVTILTALTTYFIWMYDGLRDEALFGYPAILVLSAVLVSAPIFWTLLIVMVGNIFLLAYLGEQGVVDHRAGPADISTALQIAIILVVTVYCVWLLNRDIRRLLVKLSQENQRVHQSREEIQYLVFHDPLTDLPNRLLAADHLEMALAQAERDRRMAAVIFVDLDNFKSINDSLGHHAGDTFLKHVATQLKTAVRRTDTVCRLSGDEFLIILNGIDDRRDASRVAEKLLSCIATPITLLDHEVSGRASLGISVTPEDGSDFEELARKADTAMYYSKKAGRNNYHFFAAHMSQDAEQNVELLGQLHLAQAQNRLRLHFQPRVDLASDVVVGAEAILLWHHPDQGLLKPEQFIPLAERSGLMAGFGEWMLQQACREAQLWRQTGHPDLTVSVYVSPLQFRRGNLDRLVSHALETSGLPAELLELELPESILTDTDPQLKALMSELNRLGIKLAIVDFGIGYSNLGSLQQFEVGSIKIAPSFIACLEREGRNTAIVRAIAQMASSLKLKTIAVGINEAETAERLRALGCDGAQGSFWSEAINSDQFLAFLQRTPTAT